MNASFNFEMIKLIEQLKELNRKQSEFNKSQKKLTKSLADLSLTAIKFVMPEQLN